jgi:hypothetical protein
MLYFHVKNAQCKHVLLGAWFGATYLMALQSHSLFREKLTLIVIDVDP